MQTFQQLEALIDDHVRARWVQLGYPRFIQEVRRNKIMRTLALRVWMFNNQWALKP